MSAYNVFMEEKEKLKRVLTEISLKAESCEDVGNTLMSGFLFACANTIRTSLADIEDAIHEENCRVFKNSKKQIRETFIVTLHKGEDNEIK